MPHSGYVDAIAKRRSIYNLGNKLPKSHAEVTKVIEDTIRQCPSAFNVQSSRAVILYGAEHVKLWEIVKAALKTVTPPEQYAASEGKVNGCFLAGAGTVLFYEDNTAVKGQQEAYPSYADSFPVLVAALVGLLRSSQCGQRWQARILARRCSTTIS